MSIPPAEKMFAGTVSRLMAYTIDLIILNVIFLLLFIILHFSGYSYIEPWLMFQVIFILYFAVFDSLLIKGQTPGKKKIGVQLVDFDGMPVNSVISLGRAFIISLVYFNYHYVILMYDLLKPNLLDFVVWIIISVILGLLYFGTTVFMAFHPYRQGIHDSLFKSIVINKDRFNKDRFNKDKMPDYFNYSRLFAGYFMTFIFVLIFVIIALLAKLIFFR